jgi:hypothetical protein
MMSPELQRLSDGSVRLLDLAPWFVGVILELPDLLDSDQPEVVSRRLYPDPSDDAEHQKDWDKFVRPELFALVASAREIVLRDIGTMAPSSLESEEATDLSVWQLDIPETHIQGWISALNVARLTLSSRYTLEDEDMVEPEEPEDSAEPDFDEKHFAVARVHLLGWLQQLLIEAESPPPEDFDLMQGLDDSED